jgi:diacylglycerol kinase (ATP)
MEPITFILNPTAGKGKAERVWLRAKELLQMKEQPYELLRTSRRGEASSMAAGVRTARVVAIGGDGTIQEVANGVIGTDRALGILPAGSGNDLIKSLEIPQSTEAAVDIILTGRQRYVDVGRVRCSSEQNPDDSDGGFAERYFVNGVGVGFDAAVAARTQEIPWLTGTPLYLAAVFQTLGKYEAPLFSVTLDDQVFDSRNLLFAIGNGRCAGGGFFLTPEAAVDDGLLDVCSIKAASVRRILTLMPKALSGKHGEADEVNFYRTRSLRLSSPSAFYVHADGEVVARSARSVLVSVIPGGMRVLAPSGTK